MERFLFAFVIDYGFDDANRVIHGDRLGLFPMGVEVP